MLWLCISALFWSLAWREWRRPKVRREGYESADPAPLWKGYLAIMVVLGCASAWPPLDRWRFEQYLGSQARLLAGTQRAYVRCHSAVDSIFDTDSMYAGHAQIETGRIVFGPGWCERLMDYRAHPQRASVHELMSLGILAHEAMHIRGERNEAVTECQALQRYFRAARLLGVGAPVARRNALDYERLIYRRRGMADIGRSYFSEECVAGGALDEHLPDAVWPSPQ